MHVPFLWYTMMFGLACCWVLFSGCERQDEVHREQIVALGTIVEINLWGVDKERAHRATAAVADEFSRLHQRWHAWEPSTLTVINDRLRKGQSITIDEESKALLSQAKALSLASESLFNPAIGELIALWGFHSDDAPSGPPPDPTTLEAFVSKSITMKGLIFENDTVRSIDPSLQLDLGGFAKGHAVDVAIAQLREMGIKNAIVNAGGDLRAIGRKGNRPWRIGVRDPRSNGIIVSVETHDDESVFTSGDYERYHEYQGKRYHHIIDPRNGYPARGSTSVTVIHRDAATADAAATALFIAGPEHWQSIAEKMGVEYVMLIDQNDTAFLSAAMAERIRFEVEPPPRTVVQLL